MFAHITCTDVVGMVGAAGMVTDAFADYVVGHGELWCAQLFAATVRRLDTDCGFMDTREARIIERWQKIIN